MKKSSDNIRCIHCLKTLYFKIDNKDEKATRDHVFPNSWYPDNTPNQVQRLIAPACIKCNSELGAMEKEVFTKLACCIDPKKIEASGINERLLRSLGVGAVGNLTNKELTARIKRREKLLSEMTPFTADKKPFPGLGLHTGYTPEVHMTVPVPKDLKKVSEKIIRGLEYCMGDRYIEPPNNIEVYFVEVEKNLSSVYQLLAQHGVKESHGPGFIVERVESNDGSKLVIYRVIIWGTLIIWGSIMPPKV